MYSWLNPALDYIPRWIEFQVRQSDRPAAPLQSHTKARSSSNKLSAALILAAASR